MKAHGKGNVAQNLLGFTDRDALTGDLVVPGSGRIACQGANLRQQETEQHGHSAQVFIVTEALGRTGRNFLHQWLPFSYPRTVSIGCPAQLLLLRLQGDQLHISILVQGVCKPLQVRKDILGGFARISPGQRNDFSGHFQRQLANYAAF